MSSIDHDQPANKVTDKEVDRFINKYTEINHDEMETYKNRMEYTISIFWVEIFLCSSVAIYAVAALIMEHFGYTITTEPHIFIFISIGFLIFSVPMITNLLPRMLNFKSSIDMEDVILYHLSKSIDSFENEDFKRCGEELEIISKFGAEGRFYRGHISWMPQYYLRTIIKFATSVSNVGESEQIIEEKYGDIINNVLFYWTIYENNSKNVLKDIETTSVGSKTPYEQLIADISNIMKEVFANRYTVVFCAFFGGLFVYLYTGDVTYGASAIATSLTIYTVLR